MATPAPYATAADWPAEWKDAEGEFARLCAPPAPGPPEDEAGPTARFTSPYRKRLAEARGAATSKVGPKP